jgi:hypothetical protein
MKACGNKPEGLGLERMRASPQWGGTEFRNVHPILPGLRDASAGRLSVSDFLCGGERAATVTRPA